MYHTLSLTKKTWHMIIEIRDGWLNFLCLWKVSLFPILRVILQEFWRLSSKEFLPWLAKRRIKTGRFIIARLYISIDQRLPVIILCSFIFRFSSIPSWANFFLNTYQYLKKILVHYHVLTDFFICKCKE